jgi:NaMN:DMB phosphoribosyltransferase
MGIGNTTTSAAVLSVLLGLPAEETTGRGSGLDDEAFAQKKSAL